MHLTKPPTPWRQHPIPSSVAYIALRGPQQPDSNLSRDVVSRYGGDGLAWAW